IIGDIDNDGRVDITVPIYLRKLVHFNLDDVFDTCTSPVTSWRYNRSLDGVGPSFESNCEDVYVCGDANGDGLVDQLDFMTLIDYLHRGGLPPEPLEAGDVNGDSVVDRYDKKYLIDYLHRGGPPPVCP
ncbi:MAG: dockerin type I domain-containing protein, partial [candidate division Zixibacteria bacterium]